MGIWKNLVEPGVIAAIFTTGALVNRRKTGGAHHALSDLPLVELEEGHKPKKADDDDDVYNSPEDRCTVLSRLLATFPFLLEIWYWLLTYWIYQGLRALSARVIAGNFFIFDKAQRHARQILAMESFLHIDIELFVQEYVIRKMPRLMPHLARVYYSHITLGVVFVVYCYTFLPRERYQGIRRALALENIIAFIMISFWRCAPPRLLPKRIGFIDILHHEKGHSSWTQNKFQLTIAAMPSLHFGNAILIAVCLWRFSPHWYIRMLAPIWPIMMALTIVATANHFVLDAVMGAIVSLLAYKLNYLMLSLLPVEQALFKLLRIERPGS